MDLLLTRGGRRYGFEMKLTDAPRVTKSMRIALHDLGLHALFVVFPGPESYRLDAKIEALSIHDVVERLAKLR